MDKDKRMEEIEKLADLIEADLPWFLLFHNDVLALAEQLYDAGLRKASDVAREIGAILSGYNAGNYAEVTLLNKLYELKKKYESEGTK